MSHRSARSSSSTPCLVVEPLMGGSAHLWTALWTLGACCPALASIVELEGTKLWSEEPPDEHGQASAGPQWAMEEPVFGPDDFPNAPQKPYVHLDVVFGREVTGTDGYIEVLMYHIDNREYVGRWSNPEDGASVPSLCSLQAHPDETGQAREEVFRSPEYSETHDAFYDRVFFADDATSVKFNPEKWYVQRSGMYVLRVVVCGETLVTASRPITMRGEVQYVNPYGYLPADLYGYIQFWSWMLMAHAAVGTVWLLLSVRNWRDLLHLQMCISGILFVSMVETCSWNVIFDSYNDSGRMPLTSSIVVVVLNTGKRTLSRMLVLVVSMGYGVVKPTLGVRGRRVVLLGFVYFIFATPLAIIDWVGQSPDISVGTRLIFVLPVAALDSGFSVWIFSELSATVAQLEIRNQRTKLQVYRRFSRIMATLIVVSVVWSSYELYVIGSDAESVDLDNRWKKVWQLEAMWPFLYFVVLISTMWLWAPSKNAVRYAYSDEVGLSDDDYYDESDDVLEHNGRALELKKPTLEVGGNHAVPADEHNGRTDTVEPTAEGKVLAIVAGNQVDGEIEVKMN